MTDQSWSRFRTPTVTNLAPWVDHAGADLWISCHGYESRSTKHLEFTSVPAQLRISFGFEFPDVQEDAEVASRLAEARDRLVHAGFKVIVAGDAEFERIVNDELQRLDFTSPPRVVADISSMNRSRIASLVLACSSRNLPHGCDLDLLYFPSTFASHKHAYEPLEIFGPVHETLAGWPSDPDFPLALIVGLGTEPRRADGIVETIEPAILSLFEPFGDEPDYSADIQRENRRVLEVGGEPTPYAIRDPQQTFSALLTSVERLSERARVIIVPLGPKVFCALAVGVALALGPEVGVWKASAGRGVQSVNVTAAGSPVIARLSFR